MRAREGGLAAARRRGDRAVLVALAASVVATARERAGPAVRCGGHGSRGALWRSLGGAAGRPSWRSRRRTATGLAERLLVAGPLLAPAGADRLPAAALAPSDDLVGLVPSSAGSWPRARWLDRRRRYGRHPGRCVLFAHTWWRVERRPPTSGGRWSGWRWPGLVPGCCPGWRCSRRSDRGCRRLRCPRPGRPGALRRRGAARSRRRPRGPVAVVVVAVVRRHRTTLFVAAVRCWTWWARRAVVGALALVAGSRDHASTRSRCMLRGVVDELLFGPRPDPLDAASRVAGRVGDDPALALRAIREALVLPYAALRRRTAS